LHLIKEYNILQYRIPNNVLKLDHKYKNMSDASERTRIKSERYESGIPYKKWDIGMLITQ
jgi:hypothetical protein